ncbi:MAG: molybdopterin molybdotransferase MoeA [Anaerolineales bacterium]|nr:molybdopterin molybdotransferase MoeA [Anaerolineales bacterium]
MLTVAEARRRILDHFPPLAVETVSLEAARGRYLAEAVRAEENLPPFANSSMDGFAVYAADVAGATAERPVRLPVAADIPAGTAQPPALTRGQAARIMTGAPLPAGAEAVVPVEDTDQDRGAAALPAAVSVHQAAAAGANIRPAGQDVRAGQEVLPAGAALRAAALGVLAALGHAQVRVRRRPRVAVLSTGDELVPVAERPAAGQIRDVNGSALAAAVAEQGGEVVRLGIAPDRLEAVRAKLLQAAAAGVDLILSSAGVSVGAYDVVKEALATEGELAFWRVQMRPGKPLAFGRFQGVPFIGLPGNPVSALVGMEVFVRPALLKLAGARRLERPTVTAALAEPFQADGRETYLRVTLAAAGAEWVAHSAGHQGSNIISSLVRAEGLLIVPAGAGLVPAGTRLPVWLLD